MYYSQMIYLRNEFFYELLRMEACMMVTLTVRGDISKMADRGLLQSLIKTKYSLV